MGMEKECKYHAHFTSWTLNKAYLINVQGRTL